MASPIRMSGMVSGMDTEALVSAMVMNYTEKKNKYSKAQTKLQWKQEAYSTVNSKVYSLYNKVSAFRFSSAYNMKTTKVSDSTKATITASAKAVNGTQTLQINKTAKSGYVTGAVLKKGTTEDTKLSELGFTGSSTITVRVGNTNKDIAVSGDMKISELVEAMNKSGVKASYDATNLRMFVSAAETGVENDFSLTSSDANGLMALKAVGLSLKSDANDATYLKTASYAKGLTALDGTGNIVSYYQLDANGELQKDDQGNYIVNPAVASGITDADIRQATKTSITELLTTLKDAHQAVDDAEAQKKEINGNIAYSKAYDAVYTEVLDKLDATELGMTEEELASKKEEFASVLKHYVTHAAENQYTYYGPNGAYTDEKGVEHAEGPYVKYDKYYDAAADGAVSITDKLETLAKELGIKKDATEGEPEVAEGEESSAVDAFAKIKEDMYTLASKFGNGEGYTYLTESDIEAQNAELESLDNTISANQNIINNTDASYWNIENFSDVDVDAMAETITDKIMTAKSVVEGGISLSDYYNEGATRVDAEDAQITLNGATFKSATNTFNINGLTIKAQAVTAPGETIQITTDADSQGLYDKVKDFLNTYNEVINELMKLYNADSAKGYEPLTDDEKDAMSDSEVEKWEKKIKDSLLRKDSTISGIINSMTASMMKSYEVNGKTYSLGNFGIHTLGFLNAAKNENYAYHIDGDSEDSITSGNQDKLLEAITNDPEGVQEFMTSLASGLYKELGKKMQATNLSSAYTIYNDKQMASEYSRYTKTIKTWEDKIADMEDRYYKQFSNMEKQLANIQSSSSSISSLLGM